METAFVRHREQCGMWHCTRRVRPYCVHHNHLALFGQGVDDHALTIENGLSDMAQYFIALKCVSRLAINQPCGLPILPAAVLHASPYDQPAIFNREMGPGETRRLWLFLSRHQPAAAVWLQYDTRTVEFMVVRSYFLRMANPNPAGIYRLYRYSIDGTELAMFWLWFYANPPAPVESHANEASPVEISDDNSSRTSDNTDQGTTGNTNQGGTVDDSTQGTSDNSEAQSQRKHVSVQKSTLGSVSSSITSGKTKLRFCGRLTMAQDSEKRFHQFMDNFVSSSSSQFPSSSSTSSTVEQQSRGKKCSNPSSALALVEPNTGLATSDRSSPSGLCKPWDRGDLMRRFAKPQVNVTIACKSCGAHLYFSAPASLSKQQGEKAASLFSLKLDNGHKLLCPWIENSCEETLSEFQRLPLLLHEKLLEQPITSASQAQLFYQTVELNDYSHDPYAKEFGIKISANLASVEARILPPPWLKYHDSGREGTCLPQVGQWNMMNKKMINGGTVNNWICINFSRQVQDNLARTFCQELAQMCYISGMDFNPEPVLPPITARPEQVEKVLKTRYHDATAKLSQGKEIDLLIVILPDNNGSLYGDLKRICETELGIVTHPHPGEDSSPSIAAVVASQDWPEITKYAGLVCAQAHRQELIQDLFKEWKDPQKGVVTGGMIKELLINFRRSTGHKPLRIIFYRDGDPIKQHRHFCPCQSCQTPRPSSSSSSLFKVDDPLTSVWNPF